ncbi:MAG: ArsR family transcriptional regulator [Alphaproteobacteria bacterium]|nr:ArsR family transcriptional regulator [Alphaproteobacteria bacterium]
MVEYSALDRTLAAVADPTRRAILGRLAEDREMRVTDLAAHFPISLNGVSKHISVLEGAGLLARRRDGRECWLSLNAAPLADASQWIDGYRAFGDAKLDSLGRFLATHRRSTGKP